MWLSADHAVSPPVVFLILLSPTARRYCLSHNRSWKIDLSRGSREAVCDTHASGLGDPAALPDLAGNDGSLSAAAGADFLAGIPHCSTLVRDSTADR